MHEQAAGRLQSTHKIEESQDAGKSYNGITEREIDTENRELSKLSVSYP